MVQLFKFLRFFASGLVAGLSISIQAQAFTTVTLAPGTPESIEKSFIAATTSQFQTTLFVNPLVPNTFQLTILGVNPSYSPSLTAQQVLNTFAENDFIFGFQDGMVYQQTMEENMIAGRYGVSCSTPTAFNLVRTSSQNFDANTCNDVISTVLDSLFEQSLSTPTVIPPEP